MFKATTNNQAGGVKLGKVATQPHIRVSKQGRHYLNVGVTLDDGTTVYGPVSLEGAPHQLAAFLKALGLPADTGVDFGQEITNPIPGHVARFITGPGEEVELTGMPVKVAVKPDTFNGITKLAIDRFIA